MFIVKIKLDLCDFTWLQIQSNGISGRDHAWCYAKPQGYSTDPQKITTHAETPDTQNCEGSFFFFFSFFLNN